MRLRVCQGSGGGGGGSESRLSLRPQPQLRLPSRSVSHSDAINAMAVSRDGSRLATASRDGALRIYEYPSLALVGGSKVWGTTVYAHDTCHITSASPVARAGGGLQGWGTTVYAHDTCRIASAVARRSRWWRAPRLGCGFAHATNDGLAPTFLALLALMTRRTRTSAVGRPDGHFKPRAWVGPLHLCSMGV
jgi:hypothetical protein